MIVGLNKIKEKMVAVAPMVHASGKPVNKRRIKVPIMRIVISSMLIIVCL
jgi:hypothetical protein